MGNPPLISIITASLNSESTIERCMDSVLSQLTSYPLIEYLIIDGGSYDNTLEIIKKKEKEFPKIIKWLSEKDHGIYDAMNKGIMLAKGEIIGILNSDDWYATNIFQTIVDTFQNEHAELVYGNMIRVSGFSPGTVIGIQKSTIRPFKRKMTIAHPSCFVAKRVYQQYGLFNTDLRLAADYDLLLRFLEKDVKFFHLDQEIVYFTSGGLSSNYFKSLLESTQVQKKHFGSTYAIYALMRKLFETFPKFALRKIMGDSLYEKWISSVKKYNVH